MIIDGGYLLHKVKWPTNSTYEEVCEEYADYVITKYCGNSVIVLDEYTDLANITKSHEYLLRSVTSREIQFELHMKTITTQEAFFSNRANKQRLHDALKPHLSAKGITVKQAKSDADALIVSTALQTAETTQNSVVVVGNDTDWMAILISQADLSYDNFLMVETNPPLFYKISNGLTFAILHITLRNFYRC